MGIPPSVKITYIQRRPRHTQTRQDPQQGEVNRRDTCPSDVHITPVIASRHGELMHETLMCSTSHIVLTCLCPQRPLLATRSRISVPSSDNDKRAFYRSSLIVWASANAPFQSSS